MGYDGGRRTEREHHAISQQFAFGRKFVRKPVKDEVEVQFTNNGDVKSRHAQFSLADCLRREGPRGSGCEASRDPNLSGSQCRGPRVGLQTDTAPGGPFLERRARIPRARRRPPEHARPPGLLPPWWLRRATSFLRGSRIPPDSRFPKAEKAATFPGPRLIWVRGGTQGCGR